MAHFFEDLGNLAKNPPPTKRAAYSDRTSWLMSEMSALSYLDIEEDTELLDINLEKMKFDVVSIFNHNDTQAFLAIKQSTKIAVLAFRGTESDADKKRNLNTPFTEEGRIKTHTGFKKAYEQVCDKINIEIKRLDNEDYAIYITGHSLGGALAILATYDLEKRNKNIAACYTYGSPRVGNRALYANRKTPIYRIVNARDIVPNLPPADFFGGGYIHGGDQRYLTTARSNDYSDVKLQHNNITSKYIVAKRFVVGLLRKITFRRLSPDHSINHYRDKLKAYAKKRNPQNG